MNILITEPLDFNPEQLSILEHLGQLRKGPFSRAELLKALPNAHTLIIRLGHKIDKELLLQASALKYILTPTTGLNHIDLSETEKRNIKIISLKGETEFLNSIPSTAEHTVALMLSLIRQIPAANEHVLAGGWSRDLFKAHNLKNLRLGILGFGRVGKQISNYARVFNMPWIFYDTDPDLKSHPNSESNFTEFLKKIDVLSIHIPLNEGNSKFLNHSKLKFLKKGCFVINTSRGEIVDEQDLAALLESNQLGGLATDVLNYEMEERKRNESPLLKLAAKLDNIIITPHIAGATYESMWRTEEFVIKKWREAIS